MKRYIPTNAPSLLISQYSCSVTIASSSDTFTVMPQVLPILFKASIACGIANTFSAKIAIQNSDTY